MFVIQLQIESESLCMSVRHQRHVQFQIYIIFTGEQSIWFAVPIQNRGFNLAFKPNSNSVMFLIKFKPFHIKI